jgi:acetyl-CoA synthetase
MGRDRIEKGQVPDANMRDYEAARRSFDWRKARMELDGFQDGTINIAHEAVDRHVRAGRGAKVAIRWLGRRGERKELSYTDLSRESARFANALDRLRIGKDDVVATLLGRRPELYVSALGALKNRSVLSPLFSAFGPEPILNRLRLGRAKVLITTESLYQRKVASMRDMIPSLKHVILVGEEGRETKVLKTHDFMTLVGAESPAFSIPFTDPEQRALLHFTSGTTGAPKGAVHVHDAVVAHAITGKIALDLHPHDTFWCTADPGWVTGTSYGIIAPLVNRVTMVVDEGEVDAERWYRILEEEGVTVWYTAPTAIRMLMRLGTELCRGRSFDRLRFLASVGEPLNPEAVRWGLEAFGKPFHDNWWQTETGGIMIANFASMDVKPGSMGKPLPGVEALVVERKGELGVEAIEEPNVEGELALRRGWPSMFRGYLEEEERYRKCFRGELYLTGDLVRRDEEGYFWFVGRADDVIKSAGHLIGPFEVESLLMEHPAVAEAGVIGKPDPVALEAVKAFVSLKPGFEWSHALERELLAFARTRLGPAVAPREIAFVEDIPKTKSGKIMRRLLKARELGLPIGDLSTLEGSE